MSDVVQVEEAPIIFGFPMVADGELPEHWRLAFGEWSLFIMPAVGPNKGLYWWEISVLNQSVTIKSDYRATPGDAAQAMQDYLTDLGNLITEWIANAMKVAGAT